MQIILENTYFYKNYNCIPSYVLDIYSEIKYDFIKRLNFISELLILGCDDKYLNLYLTKSFEKFFYQKIEINSVNEFIEPYIITSDVYKLYYNNIENIDLNIIFRYSGYRFFKKYKLDIVKKYNNINQCNLNLEFLSKLSKDFLFEFIKNHNFIVTRKLTKIYNKYFYFLDKQEVLNKCFYYGFYDFLDYYYRFDFLIFIIENKDLNFILENNYQYLFNYVNEQNILFLLLVTFQKGDLALMHYVFNKFNDKKYIDLYVFDSKFKLFYKILTSNKFNSLIDISNYFGNTGNMYENDKWVKLKNYF
jgi:hypothetical protein